MASVHPDVAALIAAGRAAGSRPFEAMTPEEAHALYAAHFANEPFVRVLPLGMTATTRNVRGSNYCDVSVHVVNGGMTLETVSALDNMVKGAAGQAVENMNLVMGFDETAGIDLVPTAF